MKYGTTIGLTLCCAWIVGCGGGDGGDENGASLSPSSSPDVTLPQGYVADSGRLLASGCFQCHGTNGYSTNGWDSIHGEMDDFYEDEHPLMSAQARGYSSQEVQAIAAWLSGGTASYGESDDHDNEYDDDDDEYDEYDDD